MLLHRTVCHLAAAPKIRLREAGPIITSSSALPLCWSGSTWNSSSIQWGQTALRMVSSPVKPAKAASSAISVLFILLIVAATSRTLSLTRFSCLRARHSRALPPKHDADDRVKLDSIRRNPVLPVCKIEEAQALQGDRFPHLDERWSTC